jgi:hypothetical protein
MFVEAGWLFPTICFIALWLMTTLSSSMFCEAMRKIPGNEHFVSRAEYTTVVNYYFGRKWYIASQIGLNGALQCLNIVSVIQSAQVMDNLISVIFGTSLGLNLTPFQGRFEQNGKTSDIPGSTDFLSFFNTNALDNGNAWGCHVVLSAGFLITAAMAIPCGRWNLDDNMYIQTVAFVLTILCWLVWIGASFSGFSGPESASVPAFNTNPSTGTQAGVLGNILFNFGFVTTVPSWVNEKRPRVSTNYVLWISTFMCVVIFFVVGLPGAFAFSDVMQGPVTNTCNRQSNPDSPFYDPSFNCPNDMLQLLTDESLIPSSWSSPAAKVVLKTSVYLFPVVAVVSSIPVFSIVIKYNMVENGFSKTTAFLWGVIFPWLIGFPLLYMPNVLGQFVNFTSLVFVSFTDFIVPWALYIKLQERREAAGGVLEEHSVLGELEAAEGVTAHYAINRSLGLSMKAKRLGALCLMVVLAVASLIATYLTIVQGTYTLDSQVCALVGN